jgi:hypothetical protein
MSLLFFILAALISSCSMVSQFGITGVIFHNNVMCRQNFDVTEISNKTNSTEFVNEIACKDSLVHFQEWNCICKSQPSSTIWIRTYNNFGTVAMASVLFVYLVILVIVQIVLFCDLKPHLTSFELFCPLGLFVMLHNPEIRSFIMKEKCNILSGASCILVFYDICTIALVCQYSLFHIFEIIVIVSSCIDIVFCLIETILIIKKR